VALAIGSRLGAYQIEAAIGQGGMGDVYRARDTRLDRDVAIKVLPRAFTDDADRRVRFEREAKAIAALSHPNILAIHDTGVQDQQLFVVTELLDGQNLRAALEHGALPIRKAVEIAIQVARGLGAVHDKGIVHRDLKPENVFLLRDGQVKILDFGLVGQAVSGSDTTQTAAGLTDPGTVLGTIGYMAPEQVRGLTTDARTDLFALGAVLYEMLTGARAFKRDTAADTMFAIVKDDPPELTLGRAGLSPALERILRHCLEKNPVERFQTARDVVFALEGLSGSATSGAVSGIAARPRRWNLLVSVTGVTLIAAALASAVTRWLDGRPGARGNSEPTRHVNIALPSDVPLVFIGEAALGIGQTELAVSPDGQHVVYAGRADKSTRLYVRDITDPTVRPIRGSEGAYAPFFSPDGDWVGFFAGQRLFRVRVDGSELEPLAEASIAYGGSWNRDGRIAVVTNDGTKFGTVTMTGGTITPVPIDHSLVLATPHWLPASEWVLLSCFGPLHVCAISVRTGEVRHLTINGAAVQTVEGSKLLNGSDPRYLAPGFLLFSAPADNAAMAVRFDPISLKVIGEPVPVLRGVRRENLAGSLQLAISTNGDAIFAAGANAVVGRFVWADRRGVVKLPFAPRIFGSFYLSRDKRRIAAAVDPEVGRREIWFLDLETGKEDRWNDEGMVGDRSLFPGPWLPGATHVLAEASGTTSALLLVDAARPSGGNVVYSGATRIRAEAISPNGSLFLVASPRDRPNYLTSMTLKELQGLGKEAVSLPHLIQSTREQGSPDASPDTKWLAYTSDESGSSAVWVSGLPPKDPPIRVSPAGCELPRWSPRGDGFYFRCGQRWFWVPLKPSETGPFAAPEFVLEGDYLNVPGAEYAVSADGSRLLLLQGSGERTQSTLALITNWRADLERRLPGKTQ